GIRRRLGRRRLSGRRLLARNVGLRHRTFLDRPYWLSCHAIKNIKPADFVRQRHGFDSPAVDINIGQNRSRRIVEVPNWMVHQLIMPFSLARLEIDCHETLPKEIVSWAVSAVVVGGRSFNWEVNQSELFVDGDLSPNSRIAIDGPRTVLPGFTAKLARSRDRIESP